MLEMLKPLKESKLDFLYFLAGDTEDQIHIMGSEYSNPGEKIGGNNLGDLYHIVLFRDDEKNSNEYSDVDQFEAILACPLEYASGLIPGGFYGIIARKTTTSDTMMKKLLDFMKKK
jgi:hypothetical protein